MKKCFMIFVSFLLLSAVSGLVLYNMLHVNILGDRALKSDITQVIIAGYNKSYKITDKKLINDILKEVNKTKELRKVHSLDIQPLWDKSAKEFGVANIEGHLVTVYKARYKALLFMTEDNYQYGGTLALDNEKLFFFDKGYKWSVSEKLIKIMDDYVNNEKQQDM